MTIKDFLELIRVRQWVKNLFLVIPTFFAGTILSIDIIKTLTLGILSFSFVASGIYILNDFKDREADRIHPKKKSRPLASGAISPTSGLTISGILTSIGLGIAALLNENFLWFILLYLIINIAYTSGLKNISILDLLLVSIGFIIRIYAGGVLTNVTISHWLAIMVFLLALFLVVAKRKDDLIVQESIGGQVRKASAYYNTEFVNSVITLLSATILVAYMMYTLSEEVTQRLGSEYLFTTTIFVVAGILRYLQIIFVEKRSGSPTEIFLTDKFIVLTILGWIISFYFLIYY
ncbi:MAG TPA: UbiA prenyltransferase family protein [Cyclobacteriaceae bacterium]|jgi:decaprenyl-phosphate phosphoribosyltransferase|nr:UbiA prenyltransferase family protein [Cytophagales bacterium]HCR53380.1 prenyltransferase [Cytophagales bacterium]HMR58501.1 UbiA prenyltransferase family protein [Cyclobacteriaceae bacterium]HRE68768.1 UbiA prenyltransferase family protein [Cyclobacteriaceae bacterium]HRF33574.1 UbiA prenyltransferase family protein [Cyclobacteriaceae bacterium]